LKIFQNGGTIQDGGFFTFYDQKFDFSILYVFRKKLETGEKSKMAAKNQNGVV
jgi:hypothetical protein